jgi:hypothetical protein
MTDQTGPSLGGWWRQQGRWKWWALGCAVVLIVGLSKSGSQHSGSVTSTETAAQMTPQREIEEKQTQLRVEERKTEEERIKFNEQKEHREEEQKKRLKENIADHTFTATDSSIRRYVSYELIGEKLRGVTCQADTECTVALDDYTPEKSGKIATFLGLARSTQEQLLEDPDKVFAALFADPHMREATVVSWDELETKGGKNVRWPAVSVTCDSSAASQIDWQKVSAEGVEELCKVTLLPNGSPP